MRSVVGSASLKIVEAEHTKPYLLDLLKRQSTTYSLNVTALFNLSELEMTTGMHNTDGVIAGMV